MPDNFNGIDIRCKQCGKFERDHTTIMSHNFEPTIHELYVVWVSHWEASCLCGWAIRKGLDCKNCAEIAGWIHLRRHAIEAAREWANNRGLTFYVYE